MLYNYFKIKGVISVKKTKIICSIGPASSSVEVMEQLVLNGMNCARINMSHATEEDIEKTITDTKIHFFTSHLTIFC